MVFIWISLLFYQFRLIYCASVPLEIVDMSYTFDNGTIHLPYLKKFEFEITEKGTTRGFWLQLDKYSSATHAGTHMDAPCHFAKGRWYLNDIPLQNFIRPAAVIDVRSKAQEDRDYLVTVKDLQMWERNTRHSLNGKIILIKSGWGQLWNDPEAFIGTLSNDTNLFHFPGMSADASQWLVDNRKIYGLGSETLSLDNGPSKDFMSHRILLKHNIFGLEMVANVDKLPLIGATLYVLPMKIGKACGAPVRIIATFPKL